MTATAHPANGLVRVGRGRVDARELVVVLLEEVAHARRAPSRSSFAAGSSDELAVAHREAEPRLVAAEHAADGLRERPLLARADVHVVGLLEEVAAA